jgi:hypothetical protein
MRFTARNQGWFPSKKKANLQLPPAENVRIGPGKTNSTLHPSNIPDTGLQYALNCDLDRGSFQLDLRYRKFLSLVAEGNQANMVFWGINPALTGNEQIVYDFEGDAGVFTGDSIASTTGGTAGTTPIAGLPGSIRCIWQNGDRYFFASQAGVRHISVGTTVVEGGETTVTAPTKKVTYTIDKPQYDPIDFNTGGTTTITSTGVTWTTRVSKTDIILSNNSASATDGVDIAIEHAYGSTKTNPASDCGFFTLKAQKASYPLTQGSGDTIKVRVYDGTDWYEAGVEWASNGVPMEDDLIYYVRADFTNIDAWRTGYTKVEVSFRAKLGGTTSDKIFELSSMIAGGLTLDYQSDIGRTGEMRFAYAWKRESDGIYSELSEILVVDETKALIGTSPYKDTEAGTSLRPGGSMITLQVKEATPGGLSNGTDKIVFYRQIDKDWIAVQESTLAAAGKYNHTVDYNGDGAEDETAIANYDWKFSWLGNTANATCGCVWRNSNAVFKSNGYAYFSRVDDGFEIIWDIENDELVLNPEDSGIPRTLKIAPNGDWVICAVPNDALYMFGRKGIYAMTGATPASAKLPQRVPGAMGVLGIWSAAFYKSGAVFATSDGLYYVEVTPTFTGEVQDRVLEDLTKDNRGCWEWLAPTSTCVVVTWRNEIRVYQGNKYLRISREGNVTRGQLADGATVRHAAASDYYGIVLLTTGKFLGTVGLFAYDGGTSVSGVTAGTLVEWSAKGKRFGQFASPSRIVATVYPRSDNVPSPISDAKVVFSMTGEQQSPANVTILDHSTYKVNKSWVPKKSMGTYWELGLTGQNNSLLPYADVAITDGSKMRTPWPSSA